MAGRAAFAHRVVLEDKRPRLVAMALRAAFVLTRHGESVRRFENVAAVRVVAIHATHVALDDGMMLRQIKFRVDVEMTLKTGRRVFAWIDDELRGAAGFDVFAAGTVAGFAAGFGHHRGIIKMNARVRTRGKFPDEIGVAIRAGFIAGEMRARDFQRHDD